MSEPLDAAALAAIRERCEHATPLDAQHVLMRYDHGGGRLYRDRDNGGRKLIADFYDEPDREFYYAARTDLPRLLGAYTHLEEQVALVPALVAALRKRMAEDDRLAAQGAFVRGEQAKVCDCEFCTSDRALLAALPVLPHTEEK